MGIAHFTSILWLRAALALCLLLAPASGYIRGRTDRGAPLRRSDANNIRFLVNDRTAAGLTSSGGNFTISPDSDPIAALQAAVDAWNGAASSTVTFAPLALTAKESADVSQPDGQHLITFADTSDNRNAVSGAIAITRIFFFPQSGEIIDTDMIFNPSLPFSTTLQPGTYDIEAVATHELGHALGASHSGLLGASMFFSTVRGSRDTSLLTSDEIAFLSEVYPAGSTGELGTITGLITSNEGGPVRGALVTAVEPSTSVAVGALTAADGSYAIRVPPGRYVVYTEPMDGPVMPNQLSDAGAGANTNFSTAVLGGALTPERITVASGSTARADLTVESGQPLINITIGGSGPAGGAVSRSSGAFVLVCGASSEVRLIGRGLEDAGITENTISFLGAPITLRSGSLRRGFDPVSGLPFLQFTVQVAPDAPPGLATVAVRASTATGLFSAGARIVPQPPAFPAEGVVNAASFLGGGVSPGQIVSIFGTNLGPPGGFGAERDRGSGLLRSSLANVAVTFNGVRAPLYFVHRDQINLQVPFEVAGQASAQVVVRHHLATSPRVSVPVVSVHPGIFLTGRRAIVLNQDGSLNAPENAAARGEVVVLFATGQGEVDPALSTGQFAGASPLSGVTQPAGVTFGDAAGEVLFAGLAPGFVGLLQVNARVPFTAPVGPEVPVRLAVGAAVSQPDAVLAVR
jgi:uncharacterized protein (TIGR03437 family)